jgi:hypothetical protein
MAMGSTQQRQEQNLSLSPSTYWNMPGAADQEVRGEPIEQRRAEQHHYLERHGVAVWIA